VKRLALMAGILATGCSLSSESGGPPPLLAGLPRTLTASESALVTASNAFGIALFNQVRSEAPDHNIFLSPTSAAMALGMTLNGAAGLTLDSMRVALQSAGVPLADLNAASRSLMDLLRGLDHSSEFLIANSIWAQLGIPWRQEFLDAGRVSFDAEIRSLDLQAPASVGTINDWVREKTRGKIPAILDQVASNEIMFLINAIYFKGRWRSAFDPDRTRPGTFRAGQGAPQTVPMMSREPDTLRYASRPELEAVELLYGNGAWAMTIILPREGRSLSEVTAGLTPARWQEWVQGLSSVKMGLVMPKLRLEYKRELKDDLAALGMRRAFDPDRADFGNMVSGPLGGNLYLTRATQKTFVDVNEEGTEAAAATSVGVGVTSAPMTVLVDRPFLFAIRERFSGTILFLGQITRVP
jgi:serine protease inhibitor